MIQLVNADDDWQESLRHNLYPKLHNLLVQFGGYGVASTGWDQYVGRVGEDEEVIEEELVELGFQRNPIAAYKSLPDGRKSEGSWVLLSGDEHSLVEPGMQLHITLFRRNGGQPGREVYAHYEDDWRESPIAHLRGKNASADRGVSKVEHLVDEQTFLTVTH